MSTFPTRRAKNLGGHNGPVHALTYSSGTSQYILTGCSDRLVRLYNPSHSAPDPSSPSLLPVQTYQGHGYEVLDLAVSTDNSQFASCGGDKAVYLWDVATAQIVRRLAAHSGRVEAVRWAGEGDSLLVSGSFDASVKIWDLKGNSHKPLMSLGEARDSVSCLAVWGHEVVAGSIDGKVRSYDMRMGRVSVDVIGPSVTSVCVTSDGQSMLLSCLDSTLRLMDKTTGKLLQAYKAPEYNHETFRLRSTLGIHDSVVFSGSENASLVVWDLLEGTVSHVLKHNEVLQSKPVAVKGKKEVVSAVAWCPTRKEWCSAGGDGNVVVWTT